MKPSELSSLIRSIVAEEVKKTLPLVLSEMFVRRIVSEHAAAESIETSMVEPVVTRPASVAKKPANGKRSLAETLGIEDDAQPQAVQRRQAVPQRASPPTDMSRQQLREHIRKTVLDDPETNPMAHLYEGVAMIDDEDAVDPRFGAEGVPLDMLGFKGTPDFAPLLDTSTETSRSPIPESEAMVMRRIEQQRARLDSVRVG